MLTEAHEVRTTSRRRFDKALRDVRCAIETGLLNKVHCLRRPCTSCLLITPVTAYPGGHEPLTSGTERPRGPHEMFLTVGCASCLLPGSSEARGGHTGGEGLPRTSSVCLMACSKDLMSFRIPALAIGAPSRPI